MTVKLFTSSDWQGLETEQFQIKIASGRLGPNDKHDAKKFASEELLHWLDKMPLRDDCAYVHKVAMGGSHRYGPNRWGDGFREEVLSDQHHSFETDAKAYRQHKSDGPYFGHVKIARFRPRMGVVELVTEYYGTPKVAALFGGKVADEELESLAKRGYIPVSMGSMVPGDSCFPAGTLVLSSQGYVPIEEVAVGERLLTHRGRFRKVRRTGRRLYSGSMVTLIHKRSAEPIVSTAEHPYFVLKRDAVRQPAGRFRDNMSNVVPEWVAAEDLQVGDMVLFPVSNSKPKTSDTLEMAKLFGYYAGDGSRIRERRNRDHSGPHRLYGFSISLNLQQQEIAEEVYKTVLKTSIGNPRWRVNESRNSLDLRTYDRTLAKRLVAECGDLTANKRVPAYLFTASQEEQLAFIAGLIDTDGSVDPVSGSIRIPLSTKRLVHEAYLLSLQCGLNGSYSESEVTSIWSPEPRSVYTLTISQTMKSLLREYSWKVRNWSPSDVRRQKREYLEYRYQGTTYLAVPIVELNVDLVTDVPVYNFSVDEDESYVVEGLAVHNCTICGHWAPTPADRCKSRAEGGSCELFGCKTGMLKVAPDGRMNYVDNPKNRFYDISKVAVGADPTANGLLLPLGMLASKVAQMRKVAAFAESCNPDITPLNELEELAVKLAYFWADLESQADSEDIELDSGYITMPYDAEKVKLSGLHSSNSRVYQDTVSQLIRHRQLPTFEIYAKSAGLTDLQIEEVESYVPQVYTHLIAQKQLLPVVKRAHLFGKSGQISFNNFAMPVLSCVDSHSVLRRSLLANANATQFERRKTASFSSPMPDVVAGYAALKLAFMVGQSAADPHALHGLVRRDLYRG